MNDAHAVRGAQRFEDVGGVAQRLRDGEGALCGEQGAQIRPVDPLQDEEALPGDDALVEDGDDARVNDAGGGARLAPEAFDKRRRFCQVRVHDFERNGALEALVLGDIHGGHAASGQPARDTVALVDQHSNQRVGLVVCFLVAHLVDSMGVFGKS